MGAGTESHVSEEEVEELRKENMEVEEEKKEESMDGEAGDGEENASGAGHRADDRVESYRRLASYLLPSVDLTSAKPPCVASQRGR